LLNIAEEIQGKLGKSQRLSKNSLPWRYLISQSVSQVDLQAFLF